MARRLERDEDPGTGVFRLLREHADASVVLLRCSDDPEAAIHEVRRHLKKLRALLRLARPALAEDLFRRENRFFRDCGRFIGPAREATAALHRADHLVARLPGFTTGLAPVRAAMEGRRHHLLEEALQPGGAMECAEALLVLGRRRMDIWGAAAAGAVSWPMLEDSLEATFCKARRRMARAYAGPSPERFHEWRKRSKDLRYQAAALDLQYPGRLRTLSRDLHHLTDILGEANDLTDLLRLIRDGRVSLPVGDRRALDAACERGRQRLWRRARPVGSRILSDRERVPRRSSVR